MNPTTFNLGPLLGLAAASALMSPIDRSVPDRRERTKRRNPKRDAQAASKRARKAAAQRRRK